MTASKERLIVKLLNLRGDDSTAPSDLLKYSTQMIYHWIEIEEEKKAAEAAAAVPEPEPKVEPRTKSAFDYFFS